MTHKCTLAQRTCDPASALFDYRYFRVLLRNSDFNWRQSKIYCEEKKNHRQLSVPECESVCPGLASKAEAFRHQFPCKFLLGHRPDTVQ